MVLIDVDAAKHAISCRRLEKNSENVGKIQDAMCLLFICGL